MMSINTYSLVWRPCDAHALYILSALLLSSTVQSLSPFFWPFVFYHSPFFCLFKVPTMTDPGEEPGDFIWIMQGMIQQLHNHSTRLGTLEARDVAGPSQSQMETLVLAAIQKHSKKIDKLVNDKLTALDEKFSGKMKQLGKPEPDKGGGRAKSARQESSPPKKLTPKKGELTQEQLNRIALNTQEAINRGAQLRLAQSQQQPPQQPQPQQHQHHHAQPQRENKSAAHKALGAAVDNVSPDNVKGHSEGAATHCTDSGES